MRWLGVIALAGVAHADPVTVTEVAGEVVYLDAGHAKGLRQGSTVTFDGHDYTVIEVTETSAVVQAALPAGATGTFEPVPAMAPPRPPEAFANQWPDAKPPAAGQTAAEVAIDKREREAKLAFEAHAAGTVAKGGVAGEAEARAIASFDIWRELGADVDVAGRVFRDGYNKQERTPILVRAAQLRYGDDLDPALMIGRLRYAATAVGVLDGARVATHAGPVELAAFGGIVPDADSGHPDTRGSRFGVEAIYDKLEAPWSPRVAVAAHGSTWNGKLDERRLSVAASANHARTWLDGWLEVEQFPAGNPWNAPSVQVTGAGASVDWRGDGAHAGIDATFLRPERSLRLDALLPPTWACTRAAQIGNVAESCLDIDAWAALSASAGLRGERWSIDAIGSLGNTRGQSRYTDGSGYLRGEYRLGVPRLFAAVAAGHTVFADWASVEGGAGISLPRFEAALSYRPERLDYVAGGGAETLHSLVADLHVAPSRVVDLVLSAVGTTGADRDVLAVLATVAWRPR